MRTTALWVGLLAYALATTAARAQTAPSGSYTIYADTALGQLSLQPSTAGPNQIDGTVFGDGLEGYYAAGSQQAVWIRYAGDTPIQVYVGAYSVQSGLTLPGRPPNSGSELRGTFYALNSAGGASAERNAWGFRAWGPLTLQPYPLPPNTNPPTSTTPHPLPAGPWWVTAHQSESTLALEVDANGAVSGWIFGEPIVGHYASAAGMIAFLRLRNGQPIQFYQGQSVQIAFDPINDQGIFEFQGAFFALNEPNGGASPQDNELVFNARNQWGYFTYRSALSGLCLEIENAATGDHARLRQNTCTGAPNQQFALVNTGPSRTAAPDVMVARHSGRCLDVPDASTTAGESIQQFYCHGRSNQQISPQGFANRGCPPGIDFCIGLRIIHSQQCITATGPRAADEIVQDVCTLDQPPSLFDFTLVP
jgi:hypothetical protein